MPPGGKLADIRKRSFAGLVRESELPIVPLASQRQHNFGRGKGQCFYHVFEGGKEGDCEMLKTPENIRELQRKLYRKAKQEKGIRFYLLYDKVYRLDILSHAYNLVKEGRI